MGDKKQGQPNQTEREGGRKVDEPNTEAERKAQPQQNPRQEEDRLQEETEGTSDQADGSSRTETKTDR
jgi:hypothetical protein